MLYQESSAVLEKVLSGIASLPFGNGFSQAAYKIPHLLNLERMDKRPVTGPIESAYNYELVVH